jgi:hypothetical protein
MIRKSQNESWSSPPVASEFDRLIAMVGMIDYLIAEAHEVEPLTEYFLKLARSALLEAEQVRADADGRN